MNKNQEQVNKLRQSRAELQQTIDAKKEARDAEHKAVGVAVAEEGGPPDGWTGRSSTLDKELEALHLGLGGIDERIHIAVGAANLQTAKLSSRRDSVENGINTLKEQRKILVYECLTTLRSGAETPNGFTRKVDAMDDEISTKTDELESLRAAIATVAVA
jgi:hypothetical protein